MRTTFTFAPTTLALLLSLGAGLPASAATYQYRQVIPGLVASPTPQAPEPVAELLVALSAGSLPAAMVGQPYSYDLKQLLSITGEASPDVSSATWALVAGALPESLSLSSDGLISGTPSAKNTAGATLQVKAAYKAKEGRQTYTIIVNGASLRVTQLAAGEVHTCGITPEGGVKCWGRNANNQLGDGTSTDRLSPVAVKGIPSPVKALAAGRYHTCAVTTAGDAWCWGRNAYGQLGDGTTTSRSEAVAVANLSGVASISVGEEHTCAVTSNGAASCWGRNSHGRLGDSTTTNRPTPTPVAGLSSGVTAVVAGSWHSCAATVTDVKCWGYNGNDQLGDGTATNQSTPVAVQGLGGGIRQIVALTYQTCVITAEGGAKCWGANNFGRLGNGSLISSSIPVDVSGLASGVTSIAAGHSHTCATTTTGQAYCWGLNSSGQLGTGDTTTQTSPVQVQGVSGALAVTAGANHACVATSGATQCWGSNTLGQLGDGTSGNTRTIAVEVSP